MPLESKLIHRARELARAAHAGQVRKAGNIPYFAHLEAVSVILEEHGYTDEITHAAAYLHDLVEDQPEHDQRMRAEMPAEVVAIVAALTEVKTDRAGRRLSKKERFDGYVANLQRDTEAVRQALPISCADKIHNTQSIVEAEAEGSGLLLSLSTRPGEHAPQLTRLRALYAPVVRPSLLGAFDEARDRLLETIERWLPGRAVMIAARAHLGQLDKGGHPYIEHPLRLMARADGRDAKMAAVLHDVVEDTPDWTLDRLAREGFSEPVMRALEALTKRDAETYEDFIERVARDRLATHVKLLDLADNRDLSRIPEPTGRDHARLERYQRASARLEDELAKRSLQVVLDEASRERVRERSAHPIVRGDHVTLAHRVRPEQLEAGWIPGGYSVGDAVDLQAVADHRGPAIQALRVELGGSSVRPFDGGTLHVTVSRTASGRSRDSNALIAAPHDTGDTASVSIPLRGVIRWRD